MEGTRARKGDGYVADTGMDYVKGTRVWRTWVWRGHGNGSDTGMDVTCVYRDTGMEGHGYGGTRV